MNIKNAITKLEEAGYKVVFRPARKVRIGRRATAKINRLLTMGYRVVVSSNGKRTSVFTTATYAGRKAAGIKGCRTRWAKAAA